MSRATRESVWDALTESGIPRRKYSPEHWYSTVYWLGRRVGWVIDSLWRPIYCPVALFCRGVRDYYRF